MSLPKRCTSSPFEIKAIVLMIASVETLGTVTENTQFLLFQLIREFEPLALIV